jgi:uncharacterized protein YigE (DUF2233 family)
MGAIGGSFYDWSTLAPNKLAVVQQLFADGPAASLPPAPAVRPHPATPEPPGTTDSPGTTTVG